MNAYDLTLCDDTRCTKRMQCLRYILHLARLDRDVKTPAYYFDKIINLGWGKTFTPDHKNGCSEFIPDKP